MASLAFVLSCFRSDQLTAFVLSQIPIWRRILPLWLWLPILLDRPGGDQSDAVVRMIHAASGGVVWHHQKQICSIFLKSIEAKGETRLTETRSWYQNTFVISVLYWCCKTREKLTHETREPRNRAEHAPRARGDGHRYS